VAAHTPAIGHYAGHGPDQWLRSVLALPTGGLLTGCCLLLPFNSRLLQIVTLLAQAPEDPMAAKGFVSLVVLYLVSALPCLC